MKKSRNILLGMYIINFIILLIVFIINKNEKEIDTKIYLGVYFWVINLIEIIILLIKFKKINKRSILITIAIIFGIQVVALFFIPSYSQFEPKRERNGEIIPITATVMPNYYNAYGIKLEY